MLLGKDIVLRDRAIDLARSLRSMLQSSHEQLFAGLKTLQAMVSSLRVCVTVCACDHAMELKTIKTCSNKHLNTFYLLDYNIIKTLGSGPVTNRTQSC